ncbi:lipa and NB-ARC domain protein [Aspergillus sclerotiicarbonarius CBS 121057]|uniref:Lipa and NB-ARC domain protein n=1 Tax=Aspergillus sclerotiicarbonarius (strain CBS 121057 / IBT 28362) TaxID=1448318 RepID=A0A319DXV1_ASPSB|nr:lipa and NB-ARC domain protein [Aspergillus sclerotiicarbonarius CBS 121057]
MATNYHLKRKPLPETSPDGTIRGVITISPPTPQPPTEKQHQKREPSPQPPPRPHRPPPVYTAPLPIRSATTHYDHNPQHRPPSPLPPPRAATDLPTPPPSTAQKAYHEARHFLGGLITHPTQSTKTTTILRHSHGVVFYRGSTTSVTISIFSTTPLPTDRTLWLQSKGWTGKTGMRTKALLRLTDDWLNVTPTLPIRAEQVDPADERAWQRDITKFRKKGPAKIRDTHVLRETVVVRIPVEAGDGYFQLVLCRGNKKVMCYSPVFRVLSTSLSPSSMRGASLSTMPLEMGAMVLGMYVQTAAEAVVSPVTSAIQNKVQPYEPNWVKRTAAETAYSVSGVGDRVDSVLGIGDDDGGGGGGEGTRDVQQGYQVALEDGPTTPFPVDFAARIEMEDNDGVRFRLGRVPDMILDRYHGVFFGWVRAEGVGATAQKGPGSAPGPWQGVVLSMVYWDPTQQTRVNLSQAMKKVTTIRFIDEPAVPFRAQTRVQIRIMGFLRPDVSPPRGQTEKDLIAAREAAAEAAMLADACDVSYAQSVLEHPAWAADRPLVTETHMGTDGASGSGSWMDRTREGVENVKYRGQKLAEKVPLHWIGVRAPTDEARDKQIAVNGFYILRG